MDRYDVKDRGEVEGNYNSTYRYNQDRGVLTGTAGEIRLIVAGLKLLSLKRQELGVLQVAGGLSRWEHTDQIANVDDLLGDIASSNYVEGVEVVVTDNPPEQE